MSDVDVLVAGGGVGGLTLALALGRAGARVAVVERRAGAGNVNRGDSLLPAVTRHLRALGALGRLRAAGARPVTRLEVHHHRAGLLLDGPLVAEGAAAPYLVLPPPALARCLAAAAADTGRVELRFRTRIASLAEERGRVAGAVLRSGDREELVTARLVVGADGASSTVRALLGIPLPAVPYDHGFFIVDVDRPAGYRDAMRIELHPSGGVLVVPQAGGRVGLGVLVHEEEEALFRAGHPALLLAAIGRRSPLFRELVAHPGAHLYRLHRGHAPRYVARGAALLGDAIHVVNPTAGQGMTMAVEDAAALAAHVAPALGSSAALDAALAAYEAERRPRNARLLAVSHAMSRFYALRGGLGDGVRRLVFALGGTRPGLSVQAAIFESVATRAA